MNCYLVEGESGRGRVFVLNIATGKNVWSEKGERGRGRKKGGEGIKEIKIVPVGLFPK